jgi:hypothetical protein
MGIELPDRKMWKDGKRIALGVGASAYLILAAVNSAQRWPDASTAEEKNAALAKGTLVDPTHDFGWGLEKVGDGFSIAGRKLQSAADFITGDDEQETAPNALPNPAQAVLYLSATTSEA